MTSRIASGSYGLFYEHDDGAEDGSGNEFAVHVLAGDVLSAKKGPFIFTRIGVIGRQIHVKRFFSRAFM